MATLIFAVAPAVRLTSLGLRQVPVVSTEVGRSFGSTGTQLLGKVQLPLARKTVLLGLNQVIMMAFGIVVIASQIGTGDVGNQVLRWPAAPRRQAGVLGRVLHRVRGDRPRPDHHRRATHARTAIAPRSWVVDRRKMWIACLAVVVVAAVAAVVFGAEDFPSWRIGIGSWAKSAIDWLNENVRNGVPIIGGTGSINDVPHP